MSNRVDVEKLIKTKECIKCEKCLECKGKEKDKPCLHFKLRSDRVE